MRHPAVVESLEVAAVADIQADVYRRLFAGHPEFLPLFGAQPDPNVQGEMLARAFETVLDLAEDNSYGSNMISAEAANHQGFEVAPDIFPVFFECLRDAARAACGQGWTPAMEAQWRALLGEISSLVAPAT